MLLFFSLFSPSLFLSFSPSLYLVSYPTHLNSPLFVFFDILSILVEAYRFFLASFPSLVSSDHIFLKTTTSLLEIGAIFKS
jgi:hypothetical protein